MPALAAVARRPVPSGLVSTSRSPTAAVAFVSRRRGLTRPVTAKPNFTSSSVATDDERAGFVHFILATAQDFGEHRKRQLSHGEADDIERGDRLTTHGVDVGQRVGGGDLTEHVGVVDDRRKEVDRLHEGDVVGQRKDSRVVEGLAPHDKARIRDCRQSTQRLRQVTRTQLGGSTRATGEGGQLEELLTRVGHDGYWVLGIGYWVLGIGYWVLGIGYLVIALSPPRRRRRSPRGRRAEGRRLGQWIALVARCLGHARRPR